MNDMREIARRAEEGDAQAQLAIEMFCYRIKKYIGSYYAVLGRVDAIVFTGGSGRIPSAFEENRAKALELSGLLSKSRGMKVNYRALRKSRVRTVA